MRRYRVHAALAVLASAALVAGCGNVQGSNDKAAASGSVTKHPLIGFANIGAATSPVLQAIDQGMKSEAKKRGWDIVSLNNNRDGATAIANANTMVSRGVTQAVEFQGDATVAPQVMQIFKRAHIPVIAIDIAHPGAWFFGVNNTELGRLTGHALGQHAKQAWDCKPDLVMLMENQNSGTVNDLRMGGVEKGIEDICPNIDKSLIVRQQAGATPDAAQPVARNVLAAHPDAHHILLSGLNDNVTVGALNAAEQLGRAQDVYAYGLGADLLLSNVATPGLAGSTASWLEGYPVEVFKLLDKVVAGQAPPVVDDPTNSHADFVPLCQVSSDDAKAIPPMQQRIDALYGPNPTVTTSAAKAWCPKDGEKYGLKG